jgi:probable rRNA maturation factor
LNRITVLNQTALKKLPVAKRVIEKQVRGILDNLGFKETELNILFIDDRGIRKLNREFRKKDYPTDVLSFPQDEPDSKSELPLVLGDIAISIDTARANAPDQGNTLSQEIRDLVLHGLAHILGYKHDTAGQKRKMSGIETDWAVAWKKQVNK